MMEPGENLPSKAWISHVAPFVAWIALMFLLGEPAGWKYAVRSGVCLVLFIALRPWKWDYPPLKWKNLPSATLAGLVVLAIWILPESDWLSGFESFQRFYQTVGLLMPWELTIPSESTPYAPEQVGWGFAITRLLGSAIVIAVIEEFFWRSWMTRWLNKENFLEVDPGAVSTKSILIASLLFATAHTRWIAALLCGLIWGFYYRKTRDIWAVCYAHILTNFLLGVYVLTTGNYEFWA